MILTNEQTISLLKGALATEVTENGFIVPSRFTEKGQAFYDTVKDFGKKARATSAIRLEMTTDADALSFEFGLTGASSRKFAYFDLLVDGVLLAHNGFESVGNYTGKLFFDLPAGTHHVAVYLPSLYQARLRNVTLSDGATFAPAEKSCRLLALGDSITQGYDAKFASGTYVNLLADLMNAEVVDQGIGAEVFRPDMLDGEMPFAPDYITVAYGTNDWSGQTREDMTANATEYFARLRRYFPNAKIFAITPIWRADTYRYTRVGNFEDAVAIVTEAAQAVGAVVVDGQKMIPHSTAVCSDAYLHPNDLGFKYYADNLYREIKPYL